MSAAMNLATAIQTRLQSLALLSGVDVLIDRQKDIESEVDTAVAKVEGICVTIFYSGGGIEGDTSLVTRPVFEIRLYTQPILMADGAAPADDVLEAMLAALHLWHPDARAPHDEKFKIITDPDVIPDRQYLVYGFHVQGRCTLPDPEILTPTIP